MAEVFQQRDYEVISGGTDNHLFLLSLVSKGLTGKAADEALSRANITVNKNAVPNDPQSPFVTSGLRIGTPAVTTRGFKAIKVEILANWICEILDNIESDVVVQEGKEQVENLCSEHPVYR